MPETHRTTLVAETDTSGQVTHVWISMPGWKHARPVTEGDLKSDLLSGCEFHGASEGAISAWLKERVANGS